MNVITLVREGDAEDERVKEVYRDIKESLRVSLVDAMFQAYAAMPKFLDYAWRRLRPSMLAQPFVEQSRNLGELADAGIEGWPISDHAAALHSRNYGESDLRKLREIVELFHTENPKLLIISNALRVALTGEPIGGMGVPHPPNHVDRDKLVRDFRGLHVPMAIEGEAPLRVRNTFEEIQRGTGLPFVSTQHRAMGAYPDWLDVFWTDVRPLLTDARRRELSARIDRASRDAARQLPYPLHIRADEFPEIGRINDAFCTLLPGLMIDSAIARRGLGPEPQS
jgi:uncharacterized protein YbdZ (MbtH family)